ncbi:hypothetical protein UFOVP629_12 [uncultured Caudovirales phage]|uniref:Uncharacterized protein n=1 Tax=uncultured Caudovirales phage TaxID=2100421 RepID=A0A6J5NB28_9CAUD|nr:hypothetical protein UFOVP629_12 [uncultured Caudovirales phage]
MGYREEGMFGFNDVGISATGIENPNFTYPSRSIRFLEAQAALDKVKDKYKIHRGYIRNLNQPALGADFPVSKCKFQFNPQEIRQDVSMREDVYSSLLQSPEQLTQPIGGVTSFSFDLVFDRSMELATGGPGALGADFTANVFGETSDFDVYDIGVLADLRVFYSVIGQGFSKEMLAFQMASLKSTYENIVENGASVGSPTAEITYDDVKLKDVMEANYGNAAFLMPNPVRVLFSSLFMVDGFITGTSVAFLKFNTNMVPMQCKVSVSMNAMYIGFAKEETFLTKILTDAGAAKKTADEEAAAAKKELAKSLSQTLNVFKLTLASDYLADWDNSPPTYSKPAWIWGIQQSYEGGAGDGERAAFAGFPSVKPIEGGKTTNTNGVETRTGNDIDAILKLYEAGESPTISYTWTLNVYGPGAGSTTTISESYADTALKNKTYTDPNQSVFKLMGSYTATETASSKEEWGSGTSGDGVKKERVRRRSYYVDGGGLPENTAGKAWIGDDTQLNPVNYIPDSIKNSYYIVDISVTVSAVIGTASKSEQTRNKSFVIAGGDSIGEHKFTLIWENNASERLTPQQDQS